MSQPRVNIGSEQLSGTLWSSIEIRQALNQHWRCTIVLRNTPDRRPAVESLIGQPLRISTFSLDGSENVMFLGTVTSASLTYEVSGSYGAVVDATSSTWKMQQGTRHAYYRKVTAQSAVQTVLSRNGLSLGGQMPGGPELSYVQMDESDFQFFLRLVDDVEAWFRPSLTDASSIEVETSFPSGPTVQWRQGEYGLLEWSARGRLQPLLTEGAHYDFQQMQSQSLAGISSSPGFYGGAAARMVSAVESQGSSLSSSWIADRNRAATLPDYQQRLEREARRALASAVVCAGISREPRIRAGDTLTVAGLTDVNATYGVTECIHRWTPKGYENEFTATPAQHWSQPERPLRPRVDGLYPARVVDNHDPHNQGRVRVSFWWQDDSQTTWVRLLSAYAGADRGLLIFPEIGDEVLVAFEEGDAERPYVLGSVWNGVQQPPSEGYWMAGARNGAEFQNNDVKRLVTKSGHRITIVDTKGQETITLATPKGARLTLTEKANETGRPAIVLETCGDMIFSAPHGRIHFHSATNSRQVG